MSEREGADTPGARLQARRLIRVVVVLLVVYAAWLGVGPHRPIFARDVVLGEGVLWVATAVAVLRAQSTPDRRWWFLAVGMGLWSAADTLFTAWPYLFGGPAPTPSVCDLGYLTLYPLVYAWIFLSLRRKVKEFNISLVLDGVVVALGAATLGSIMLHRIVAQDHGASVLAATVNASYPIGDCLLILFSLSASMLFGLHRDRSWNGVTVGLLIFAASDTEYLVQGNSYHPGTLLDAGWATAMVVLAVASWQRGTSPATRASSSALVALPVLVSLSSIIYIGYSAAFEARPSVVGIALASSALIAALVRTTWTIQDVSLLAEARHQADTDDLTGLPNRRLIFRRIKELIDNCTPTGLLLLDLDRFKEINDALGHSAGDELLRQIGPRLTGAAPRPATVARIGGDEFAVVIPNATAAAMSATATAIVARMAAPFTLDGATVHVSVSIGGALCPDDGDDRSRLLRSADSAMYRAKRSHAGYAQYSAEMNTFDRQRLQIIEDLRSALETNQLFCHYQPKVHLSTGTVTGVEALARWNHPTKGMLPPSEFIPLSEEIGLMSHLIIAMLDSALEQSALWIAEGRRIPIAVNLSPTNLLDVHLPALVARMLSKHGVPAELLELEMTEDAIMTDPPQAVATLLSLRGLGVKLAVDDYGSGYASLAYIRDLPVDSLKIDRTFVTGISRHTGNRAIVQSTVLLANVLGLGLIAEGVETGSDWSALTELGVDQVQGFFICKPKSAEELIAWLDGWNEDHRATALEAAR